MINVKLAAIARNCQAGILPLPCFRRKRTLTVISDNNQIKMKRAKEKRIFIMLL